MPSLTPNQTKRTFLDLRRSLSIASTKLRHEPTFLQVMTHSPDALRAYILADAALARGQLTRRQRRNVAQAVGIIRGPSSSRGRTQRLLQPISTNGEPDPKSKAIVHFSQAVTLQRAEISDDDFQILRRAGFSDLAIVEIVSNIVLNIFSNYLNFSRKQID